MKNLVIPTMNKMGIKDFNVVNKPKLVACNISAFIVEANKANNIYSSKLNSNDFVSGKRGHLASFFESIILKIFV